MKEHDYSIRTCLKLGSGNTGGWRIPHPFDEERREVINEGKDVDLINDAYLYDRIPNHLKLTESASVISY